MLVSILLSSIGVSAIFDAQATRRQKESVSGNFIVMFDSEYSEDAFDAHLSFMNSQASLLGEGGNQIKHVYSFEGARGYSGKFDSLVVEQIRQTRGVSFVEQDSIVYAQDVEKGAPWGLARVSRREALGYGGYGKYFFDARGGENVTTYVIDTGVNWNHEDFQGRASWGVTIPEYDGDFDGNGHGSHCGGTIAGHKYGVAKKAKVVAVKVLTSSGSGSMSDVLKGVEWAAKAAKKEAQEASRTGWKHKGSVANMSLGGGFSSALNRAINAAVKHGLNFAVAAGNEDEDACQTSPASAKLAITVGASDISDRRAWFSNWGTCVDVFAPGVDILSIWRGNNHATNTISGTSMASPHVAGVMAYLLSLAEKPLTHQELRDQLIELATSGALSNVSESTPNLLVYTNPPQKSFD